MFMKLTDESPYSKYYVRTAFRRRSLGMVSGRSSGGGAGGFVVMPLDVDGSASPERAHVQGLVIKHVQCVVVLERDGGRERLKHRREQMSMRV